MFGITEFADAGVTFGDASATRLGVASAIGLGVATGSTALLEEFPEAKYRLAATDPTSKMTAAIATIFSGDFR